MWLMVQVLLLFLFCYCTDLVKDFYLILFVELLLFIKPSVFVLSAAYFRLSVHSCLLFGSAFGSRMMLKDLKEAFKWNINCLTI